MNTNDKNNDVLADIIQKLTIKDFANFASKTWKPEDVMDQQLINYIKNIPSIKKLGDATRNRISRENVDINGSDYTSIIFLISHFGPTKRIQLPGFLHFNIKQQMQLASQMQTIEEHDLDMLANTTKFASEIKKEDVLKLVKGLWCIKWMQRGWSDRITTSNITLIPNDDEGILQVKLSGFGFGSDKTHTIKNFVSKL